MTRRLIRTSGLVLLLIMLIGTWSSPIAMASRDPLASVVDMSAPQTEIMPPELFTTEQTSAITGVVNEARLFGVPLVVRVISVPISFDLLDEVSPAVGASPDGQQLVQRMADEWLADEKVETSPGAGDGFVLFVVVPEDDHTRSLAAFATGQNALPLNGLTQSSLEDVLNSVIYPFFADNRIATGIHSGISYLSYDNLFAVPARRSLSHQQESLRKVTNFGLASLTVLSVVGLAGLVFWINRRNQRHASDDAVIRTPLEAGAIARGRIDDAVITGGLLQLVRLGALQPEYDRSGQMALILAPDVTVTDPYAAQMLQILEAEANGTMRIQGAAMRRMQDILNPVRKSMRDDFVSRHMLNRDALVETVWVVLACGVVTAIAIFSVMPSMMGLSRLGIFGIALAAIAVVLALAWVAHRSWATNTGQQALAAWQQKTHSQVDRVIFESILTQDALLTSPGGPTVSDNTQLVRGLRALGAG